MTFTLYNPMNIDTAKPYHPRCGFDLRFALVPRGQGEYPQEVYDALHDYLTGRHGEYNFTPDEIGRQLERINLVCWNEQCDMRGEYNAPLWQFVTTAGIDYFIRYAMLGWVLYNDGDDVYYYGAQRSVPEIMAYHDDKLLSECRRHDREQAMEYEQRQQAYLRPTRLEEFTHAVKLPEGVSLTYRGGEQVDVRIKGKSGPPAALLRMGEDEQKALRAVSRYNELKKLEEWLSSGRHKELLKLYNVLSYDGRQLLLDCALRGEASSVAALMIKDWSDLVPKIKDLYGRNK